MKLYTIATKVAQCYGHGSYGDELVIKKTGPYGTDLFPPLFKTKKEARNHLKEGIKELTYFDAEVVELIVL